MPCIFNYGPQSGWKQGTGGTNRFLGDGGPLLHQFCLKSLHSWVGRGAGLGLQDWPDWKVQRGNIRVSCKSDFLAYEWGDFPLNPRLGDLVSVRGRRLLLQGPGNCLEVLLGTERQVTLQNIGDERWEFNLTPECTKSRGDLPVSVAAAQIMTDCGFWRLVTILPSVDNEEAQTRPFCWLTTCWM